MTQADIALLVSQNLDDSGVFYDPIDITASIQDGYDDVAVFTSCIEKTVNVNFVSGLVYYDLSTLIPDYYAARSIYNNNTNRYLNPTSQRSLRTTRLDWEKGNGEPEYWCPVDYRYIGMWRIPATATGNFTVLYAAKADTLAPPSTPLIHKEYQYLLEKYATADLLEQAEEFTKAQIYWNEYIILLDEYYDKVESLAKADRIFALTDRAIL